MEEFNKESKYIRAKERVDELKKFYGNLTSYIIVCTGLGLLNYFTYWGYKWFLWVVLGWGIGVFFHAIGTFNLNPFFGKDWEKRKIKKYMDEDKDDYPTTNRWE